MKKIMIMLAAMFALTSCGDLDDMDAPSETFSGAFIDKETGDPIQTEVGDGGIQIYMYETSYKDNPTPWTMTCHQDGTFINTKVFAATYTVLPYGPFVPFTEQDEDGNYTKDERLKDFVISGTTTHTFEVEPLLRIKVVSEPTVTDNKISVTVRVERGTSNANYQQDVSDIALFVNNSSTYVGNNNYDGRISTFISGDEANAALGQDITLTSGDVDQANGGNQKYYIRVGARTSYSSNGRQRYNYTEPMTVQVP